MRRRETAYSATSMTRIVEQTLAACRELLTPDAHGRTTMSPEATQTILATIGTWGIPVLEMDDEQAHSTWLWSDLHLRDLSSVRVHRRPFWNCRTHDWRLTRRWRRHVKPNDTTIHAGDFAPEDVQEAEREALLEKLPGRKINVLGNHDIAGLLAPLTNGWDESHGALVLATAPPCVVTHCPLRTVPPKTVNVHGHMHNRRDGRGDRHINVAVEQTRYHPVRVSKVIDEAARRLAGEHPRPLNG